MADILILLLPPPAPPAPPISFLFSPLKRENVFFPIYRQRISISICSAVASDLFSLSSSSSYFFFLLFHTAEQGINILSLLTIWARP